MASSPVREAIAPRLEEAERKALGLEQIGEDDNARFVRARAREESFVEALCVISEQLEGLRSVLAGGVGES